MVKNIVILGAGFGGLRATFALTKILKRLKLRNAYRIILVDRNAYHTYTPTLYEVATTSKETANYCDLKNIVTFDVEKVIPPEVSFIKAEVGNVDLVEGDIHLQGHQPIKFHYLLIALGSEANDFGISGVKKYGFQFKTFLDALKIRDAVLEADATAKKPFRIVIGGGGSTGVELAGEIQEWLCHFDGSDKICQALVTIVDSAPSVLGPFPQKIQKTVTARLKKLGTEIINNERIEKVRPKEVILKSGRLLPADIFIWAGGVKAPYILGQMPLKIEARGRIEVVENLECLPQTPDLELYGKIYGIGDSICFYDPRSGQPIPQVARAAISQANIAAHNICEDIKVEEILVEKAKHKIYRPMEYPYIIPVGGKYAVAKFGPFVIAGFLGWILKGLVELNYLISIMPIWRAISIWFKGLKIFIQNDRLG